MSTDKTAGEQQGPRTITLTIELPEFGPDLADWEREVFLVDLAGDAVKAYMKSERAADQAKVKEEDR